MAMTIRRLLPALAALALLLSQAAAAAEADKRRAPLKCAPAPLLQPGKTQLAERVLVRPGARLAASPGAAGDKAVPAFSVLYLYDRSADGKAVQVGARSDCKPQGWLAADAVIPWRHAIAVAFANRTGRERVPFFDDPARVQALLKAPDAAAQISKLLAREQGPGLATLEPKAPVDIKSQFYLLPVLDTQPAAFANRLQTRLLHVAAISLTPQPAVTPAAPAAPPPAAARPASDERQNFRSAVVFVVDATKSTQPYIDRMRQSLDKFYAKVEAAHLEDSVRFGLIGYRDDPAAVKGIEYLTKIFVDPNTVSRRAEFNAAAAGLKAATISSRAEAEDGFSGINAAIEGINWEGFSGRFVVMITDAASREPGPLAKTPFDAHHTRLNAAASGIALLSVHLLTPEGSAADHERARAEYREMTAYPGREPLYYPIQTGDINKFGTAVETIADSLVRLVGEAEAKGTVVTAPDAKPGTAPGKIAEDIAAIGHAMRLAYLGRTSGSTLPPMFDSWTVDRDFARPEVQSLVPGVFLTKAELSDLQVTVNAVADAFENAKMAPSKLYAELRSAALLLSRDPASLGSGRNKDIAKAILGEYLDGLPYTSQVMAIDRDDWEAMDVGRQQELIDGLAQKARLYQKSHDNVANWVKLAADSADEDAVCLIPLDTLP
ncbi:MAG: vWA domain-containing protein [Rhodospirillaceae bacterium]